MQEFTEKDLELFKMLAKLDQASLKTMLSKLLKNMKGYTVQNHKDYIAAKGDIPIVLVAHMDTVFSAPPENFFYDPKKGALWSPDGLGADDRAGVFAILKIIGTGLRPHILFTCDEEVGGYGAIEAARNKQFFGDVKYLIQLDRRGMEDCVFYDCDNIEFTAYIEQFGFKEAWGTFSDISIICPMWRVAGVNLSVGYYGEHTICEVLMANELKNTINKVMDMLNEKDIPNFKYIPMIAKSAYKSVFGGDIDAHGWGSTRIQCEECRSYRELTGIIEIEDFDENIHYVCGTCFDKSERNVGWCYNCGYAYELNPNVPDTTGLCYSCERNGNGGRYFGFKENEGYC